MHLFLNTGFVHYWPPSIMLLGCVWWTDEVVSSICIPAVDEVVLLLGI
jgi:hypothetical protein